ncbi:multiple sugar transport system substrate-binding protein [Paenibacillus anaericanus]|uniref:ABC transporter substrate-binding protein n=1 Tax=Paenibacillus anaericanus TaxID=170367 RepID=UPI00278577BE|nr:extracellular solute-binding protein [Paenibacillus anaericanus]MDQ0089990.1 multiple sugar transport system substrate-binding protein [Paenibacillus anaericanus]
MKFVHKAALFAMSCLLVVGCSAGPGKETVKEKSSLKVMFYSEDWFYQQYGDLFAMKHPEIEIEVVSHQSIYSGENTDSVQAFKDLVEKEQPDILMLDTSNYETFASDGKLMELDTLIARDKYPTETIYPGLMELLKEEGGGKLYGLSPSFYGTAIFYNADLFAKYGVELPHDGMTWQDIMDTARRFPTDGDEKTRIYGYGMDWAMSVSNMADTIARTEGLRSINPDTMKITLNTDSWKDAYQLAIDALDSNAIYVPDSEFGGGSMEEYYQSQLFVMGRMAMTIGHPYNLKNIKQARESMKDYKSFELGMAAGPVNPTEPDTTRESSVDQIFAIRANSPNVDAAWEFMKFINGDEYAKIKSKSMSNELMSRMGHSKEYDGHSLETFYKLKPSVSNIYSGMEKIPSEFYGQYQPIVDRELALVKDKTKSIGDALASIEAEGQVVLDKAVKDAEAKKNNPAEDKDSGEVGADTGEASSGTVTITN